jgi:hypothetical protein
MKKLLILIALVFIQCAAINEETCRNMCGNSLKDKFKGYTYIADKSSSCQCKSIEDKQCQNNQQ